MSDLKQELERAAAPKEQQTILTLIERQKPAIERALPAAFLRRDPDRFVRTVLTEIRRSPQLMDCSPESLLGALMLSAQLGLEPGPLGNVYLVPFKRQVTFILGYTGILALAYRSGMVKSVTAQPVYEDEAFRVVGGSGAKIVHELLPPDERGGSVKAYYALAKLKTGGEVWKVLYPDEIEAHRRRSPAAKANTGPWITDHLSMALKTTVKVLRPWLPLSAEFGRAVAVDEQAASWNGEAVQADVEAGVEDMSPAEGTEA